MTASFLAEVKSTSEETTSADEMKAHAYATTDGARDFEDALDEDYEDVITMYVSLVRIIVHIRVEEKCTFRGKYYRCSRYWLNNVVNHGF